MSPHFILDLLSSSIQNGDSDLHLIPGSFPAVRNQVGDIQFVNTSPCLTADVIADAVRMALPAETDWNRAAQRRRLDATLTIADRRVRLHYFRQSLGWAAAIRILPASVMTLGEIGGPAVVQQTLEHRSGLILIVGPGGSGKSTTISAQINEINRQQARNIVTAEEPVEVVHTPLRSTISQRSVPFDVASVEDALFDALRGDCNVFVAGELRDARSIRAAVTAADTGLLVIATAHARNASSGVQRLVDAFPAEEKDLARSMIADSLRLIAAQALVKDVSGARRTAVFETLTSTPATRNLIRTGRFEQLDSAIQSGASHGMETFKQSVERLASARIISREEASSVLRGRTFDA